MIARHSITLNLGRVWENGHHDLNGSIP
jgi:hypothetical protein